MSLDKNKDKDDRRGADRFPIEREVRYKILSRKNAVEDEGGTGPLPVPGFPSGAGCVCDGSSLFTFARAGDCGWDCAGGESIFYHRRITAA